MPYIYFSTLLVFLSIYAFFMTVQLFNLIKLEIFLKKTLLGDVLYSTSNELSCLVSALFTKKQWLKALILLETPEISLIEEEYYYLNIAGVIYQNMKDYDLAQLYYLKSLYKKPAYSVAAKNLSLLKDKS